MNFEKTEKPRIVSVILQIKPYTLYMWKWWGFPEFKQIFSHLSQPRTNFSIFDLISSHDMQKQIVFRKSGPLMGKCFK